VRQRWQPLDDLRGLAVFVMVPANVAASFNGIPAWFKHAPAVGLTLPDFVVPVFLFSLGLSASFSFSARIARDGFAKTLLHAFVRYGVLFAFGTIGILLVDRGSSWEILQMLGATGMFSFFFMLLPPWPRLGAAALLLAIVETLRPMGLGGLMSQWYDSGIAGPWGTFSLSFFPIAASALGEMVRDAPPRRKLITSAATSGVLFAGGALALVFFPFSKHLLSLSYVCITGGAAAALLALLVLWRETLCWPVPLLGSLGRNPLLLYILHAVLGVAVHALLDDNAASWIAWAASFGVLAVCLAAAMVLELKKIFIRL
jgi:predicted acyltransferase